MVVNLKSHTPLQYTLLSRLHQITPKNRKRESLVIIKKDCRNHSANLSLASVQL